MLKLRPLPLLLVLCFTAPALAEGPLDWPLDQQEFWFDGAAWLMPEAERRALRSLSDEERGERIESFLADPVAATASHELQEAIALRQRLIFDEFLSARDERAQLVFLRGKPDARSLIDCSEAFKPLEIWRYGTQSLVLYKPSARSGFRLWLPLESKRVLYTQELEFWLEEFEIYKGRIIGKRVDRTLCQESKLVDEVTGVDGMFGIRPDQPLSKDLLAYLAPPEDLAAWTEQALRTRVPEAAATLEVDEIQAYFPERSGLLMKTEIFVTLPPDVNLVPYQDGDRQEVRFAVEGVVETEDGPFETFRVRYAFEPPETGVPYHLAVTRHLRPGGTFRLLLRVQDEVGEAGTRVAYAFTVPREPERQEAELARAALAPNQRLDRQLELRPDGLVLLVPPREVVFGSVRAQAVVRGERIASVSFLVDGEPQLTRRSEPWAVELALPNLPREVLVAAEGHDAEGAVVARDEVLLNQPRGELGIDILEPARGVQPRGPFRTEVRVVVPEGRRVEAVELQINDQLVKRLESPPWVAELEMPQTLELTYLTAVAYLDDESRAEDVRFLNAPYEMGEVAVQLVELYTTVLERTGGLVRGLERDQFVVREDGREQALSKFELVTDLPLTVGITIDTSGSMFGSLGEAQRAAVEFLDRIVSPRDQCFAVGFSDEPRLIMPRTEDVGAVAASLEELTAEGWTSLHDAIVFSLYYHRDVKGRRVLVLLSDGDDTDSRLEFEDALEYARQSAVVIYTIGLKNESLNGKARRKLRLLAEETGGRTFLIDEAEELRQVYAEIEDELRSQYLLAYASDSTGPGDQYRRVEVEVKKRGMRARTIHGYYP